MEHTPTWLINSFIYLSAAVIAVPLSKAVGLGSIIGYLAAGIAKKLVPIVMVASRDKAEFEISGIAESEKAGWAKMLVFGSQQSREQAGIKVLNLKTDEVVFAYAVNKGNSVRGKQSAAEACAKHLKEKVEGAGK